MTIIGIVGDVRNTPEIPALAEVYVHYLQRGALDSFSVVVHASGDLDALARQVTSEIRSMNPEASIRVRTPDEMFSSSTAGRRFNFTLLTTFAASALVLALLGIYSAIAYSVSQRNQEIGIRMALGARPIRIAGLFLAEGLWMVVAGALLGLVGRGR